MKPALLHLATLSLLTGTSLAALGRSQLVQLGTQHEPLTAFASVADMGVD